MKTRIALTILVAVTFMLAVLAVSQTSGNTANTSATQQVASTDAAMPMTNTQSIHSADQVKKTHAMHTLSADDAYKQNCTRCHSEVPQANARTTKTVLRHMRVRANITQDEAKAILDYLTQ